MRNFIFLIGAFLFLSCAVNAQQCGCYYPYYYGLGPVYSISSEPTLHYEIVNIVEYERFYVTVKAWDRTYSIPVINGLLPELETKNGNPYNLVLDYKNGVRYSKAKHGVVVVYTVDGVRPSKVNNNLPMAPKQPGVKNKTNSSNTPKRPDTKELDGYLDLPSEVKENFREDSDLPKRPSYNELDRLIEN